MAFESRKKITAKKDSSHRYTCPFKQREFRFENLFHATK